MRLGCLGTHKESKAGNTKHITLAPLGHSGSLACSMQHPGRTPCCLGPRPVIQPGAREPEHRSPPPSRQKGRAIFRLWRVAFFVLGADPRSDLGRRLVFGRRFCSPFFRMSAAMPSPNMFWSVAVFVFLTRTCSNLVDVLLLVWSATPKAKTPSPRSHRSATPGPENKHTC